MEYTVQRLGRLAGVSTRTLRYYDEIGLLRPARISSAGYRIYGQAEVDRLQHILFFRELGVSLEQIKVIMEAPTFQPAQVLKEHRAQLLDKRKQLDLLIANVEKTIAMTEGRIDMKDEEKFEGFKQQLIEENERKYGTEVRERYGEDTVNQSNAKLQKMTEEEYEEVTRLAEEVMTALTEAFRQGDPAGELAMQAAELHKRWISYYWPSYTKEAHAGVAQMYVDDERFTAYYDAGQPGMAEFLRDAIHNYTGMRK